VRCRGKRVILVGIAHIIFVIGDAYFVSKERENSATREVDNKWEAQRENNDVGKLKVSRELGTPFFPKAFELAPQYPGGQQAIIRYANQQASFCWRRETRYFGPGDSDATCGWDTRIVTLGGSCSWPMHSRLGSSTWSQANKREDSYYCVAKEMISPSMCLPSWDSSHETWRLPHDVSFRHPSLESKAGGGHAGNKEICPTDGPIRSHLRLAVAALCPFVTRGLLL